MGARAEETIAEYNVQSKEYYVEVVKELSGKDYYGRSNYNNGTIKAAEFILAENDKLENATIVASYNSMQELVADGWVLD